MEGESFNCFAHVGVGPVGDLSETAAALGKILGLSFMEDNKGLYDEFPTYIAEAYGLRYALLGTPDQEYDIRDDPTNDFELLVEPIKYLPSVERFDVTSQLVSKIKRNGSIECWALK